MAFFSIENVKMSGVSACVPRLIDENRKSSLMTPVEMEKLISSVGVERKRIADQGVCASDLCQKAAEQLIVDLCWNKEEIDCLVFVSQTPDYILPATSCILQDKLGLSKECLTIDISLGCSGWVHGLSTVAALLSSGCLRKGLLLVGDISSQLASPRDKSTWLLFGDAGTATALEYRAGAEPFRFHLATDGAGFRSIMVKDGGFRNVFSEESLSMKETSGGNYASDLHSHLEGMDVFSFAISRAPESVNALLEKYTINKESVDRYVFHQANLFLNEKIRKKLKIGTEKVPYSLRNFGNTSCASIPLTMVTETREELSSSFMHVLGCGFGVGLSWGSVYFSIDHIVCSELIEF